MAERNKNPTQKTTRYTRAHLEGGLVQAGSVCHRLSHAAAAGLLFRLPSVRYVKREDRPRSSADGTGQDAAPVPYL